MLPQYCISLASVQKAQAAISGLVHRTPILTNSTLDRWAERQVFLKCELFQKTGSFKIRGALNAVSGLAEGGQEGLQARAAVTHSSGNHGQALALAARMKGIPSYVVVPRTAPACKKAAMLEYGAHLLECEPTDETQHPHVKIYAAEPENADDCYQSKRNGCLTPNASPPVTLADAVKTSIGANTWPIIRDLVDDVFTVSEEEIQRATRLIWERAKLVIEPTAGLGVAAVLSRRFRDLPGSLRNVCVVLCGGNVDLDSLEWLRAPSVAS
ncbi:serine racemase isoform X4 [Hypanus sabinus]|uniref:serine racemase isoform X4 n=1 Tax=Hypanus sabinus TaxID=79690 RepID=UPI0028C4B547|nr:serine racemase isoform X4 [Hypanus sabinus]